MDYREISKIIYASSADAAIASVWEITL